MSFYKNVDSSIIQILPKDLYVDSFEHSINGIEPYVINHKDKIFKLIAGEVLGDEFRECHLYIKTVIDYPYCSNCDRCIFGGHRKICLLQDKKRSVENQIGDSFRKIDFLKTTCDCIDCHFEEVQL